MSSRITAVFAAALALPLALTGCTTTAPPEPINDAHAQLQDLRENGQLPETFPTRPSDLRVEIDGDTFAIAWKGDRISGECTASTASPNSASMMLLLQDVGLEDVEQCGNVWQATQADGSHIAWN